MLSLNYVVKMIYREQNPLFKTMYMYIWKYSEIYSKVFLLYGLRLFWLKKLSADISREMTKYDKLINILLYGFN